MSLNLINRDLNSKISYLRKNNNELNNEISELEKTNVELNEKLNEIYKNNRFNRDYVRQIDELRYEVYKLKTANEKLENQINDSTNGREDRKISSILQKFKN